MKNFKRKIFVSLFVLSISLLAIQTAEAVPNPRAIQWKASANGFVRSLYVGVLGRNPENPRVVTEHARKINSNPNSRLNLFNEFIRSPEYRSKGWGSKKRTWTVYSRLIPRRNGGYTVRWSAKSSPNTNASDIRHSGPHLWGVAISYVTFYNTYRNYRR